MLTHSENGRKNLYDFYPSEELAAMKNKQVGRISQTLSGRTQGELPIQTQVNPKVDASKTVPMVDGVTTKKAWTDIYTKKYVPSDRESEPDYATDYDSEGITISFEHLLLRDPIYLSDEEEEDSKQGEYAEFMIPKPNKVKGKAKEEDAELIYIAPIKHDPGSYSLPFLFLTTEAVPIRIGNFVYLTEFIVADLPKDTEIPIILGRTFLHTAQVNLDMRNQVTTLGYDDKRISFNPDGEPVTHLHTPYVDPSQTFKEKANWPLLPHEQKKKMEDYPISQPIRNIRSRKRGNPTGNVKSEKQEQSGFATANFQVSRRGICSPWCQRTRSTSASASAPNVNYRAPDGTHAFTHFMNDSTLSAAKQAEYRDIMDRIKTHQIVVPRRPDWTLLQTLEIDGDVKAVLEKHAIGENGLEYYICKAWDRVFNINEILYRELILEFVTTYTFNPVKATEDCREKCVSFRLGGTWRSLSLAEFGVALGIYTQAEVNDPGFEEYMVATSKTPEGFNPREVCDIFGNGNFLSNIKVKGLLSPLDRLLHCMLVHVVNSRSSSEEKIPVYDLWLLSELSTDDRYPNAPYIIPVQL
ncbi:hypothetical protein OSB04_031903 [Centaurea solstitialis]|uniref:Uncharacterized protein n=1 Tax=Centaurea solstitialis TaxID=347529 RepID=A0AA38SN12_9ASTR|nr:hypothetical protein OSB04_031903 [Centaurea solstitialis]